MPKSETMGIEIQSGGQPCRFEVHVLDTGNNPLITIHNDDLAKLLRWIADRAGYQDRAMSMVQAHTDNGECANGPMDLVLMVSNIPGDRKD